MTQRGRPVLRRIDTYDGDEYETVWGFCGEHRGNDRAAVDEAAEEYGHGVYKVFPSGSWPGGYLRD